MGGGILQINAYGSQDVYLTGNPQITFFKSVYRRYTNFSIESHDLSYDGTGDVGQNINCKIERIGDLLTNLNVYVKLGAPTSTGTLENWTNAIGYALLKQIDLEIGGERIDRQYGLWLDIWNELDDDNNDEWNLVGKVANPAFKTDGANHDNNPHLTFQQNLSTEYYVPLRFWFCGKPGLALPLISLQHQNINLKINIRSRNECVTGAGELNTITGTMTEFKIYGDYIYLDVDERRKFAEGSHEYLIEQLQFQRNTITSNSDNEIELNFNHPCKDIIWVFQNTTRNAQATGNAFDAADYTDATNIMGNDWFNYNGSAINATAPVYIPGSSPNATGGNGVSSNDPFTSAQLQFNGANRFSARPPSYFKYVQPLTYYQNMPGKNVYCYSFALKPCEHQPSGTCNFSRLDNAKLKLNHIDNAAGANLTIAVFTRNYNVLRISSGMSGLAYNN